MIINIISINVNLTKYYQLLYRNCNCVSIFNSKFLQKLRSYMSEIFNPHDKILCHITRVKDYFENKNPYPITIEIDPSNACNHSCSFCISGHIHSSKYKNTEFFNRTILNKNVFKKLIEELITTDIKAINWTGGGEPTLNPFLGEAINYIKKNYLKVL